MGVKRLREYPLNRDSINTEASLDRSDEANDHFFFPYNFPGKWEHVNCQENRPECCEGGGRLSCDVLSPHLGGIDMLFCCYGNLR